MGDTVVQQRAAPIEDLFVVKGFCARS